MAIDPGEVYLVRYKKDNTLITNVYIVAEDVDQDLAVAVDIDVIVE